MPQYSYRLLNVFAESRFSGNPLCVFEDGTGLSDDTMLNLARQFNLSETVFLFPAADHADATLRIFTPTGELPFAGHPSIGSAHVVQQSLQREQLTLKTKAGIVALSLQNGYWSLEAPRSAMESEMRHCDVETAELCHMLGLDHSDVESSPLWINTGSEQLLLPLRSLEALERARPNTAFAESWPGNGIGRKSVFLFAAFKQPDGSSAIRARHFFKSPTGIGEDPGTGSVCINLGAWFFMKVVPMAQQLEVTQGVEMGRPCLIQLDISAHGAIRIGGRVVELGGGHIDL